MLKAFSHGQLYVMYFLIHVSVYQPISFVIILCSILCMYLIFKVSLKRTL
jgi:hypothetical protein